MWHIMTECSPTDGVSSSALFSEDALGTTEAPKLHARHFEQSKLRSDFTPALSAGCDLFCATVQISPIELVKRHCMERYGIVTESIYAPTRSRIEIRYDAPAHLLVLYEDGVRREARRRLMGYLHPRSEILPTS